MKSKKRTILLSSDNHQVTYEIINDSDEVTTSTGFGSRWSCPSVLKHVLNYRCKLVLLFLLVSSFICQLFAAMPFDSLIFIGYTSPSTGGTGRGEVGEVDQYYGWNASYTSGLSLYLLKGLKTGNGTLVDIVKNSTISNGRLKGKSLAGGSFLYPSLSYDGKVIAFAWTSRADQSFHIFKVNIDGTNLVQLTDGSPMPSGGRPEETLTGKNDSRVEDFDPCWLPSGRIVFISERRGGFGRCHDLNVKPTYTLYSMKDDGSDLYCIDYHETNEWHPSVNNDGMIVYSRWDYIDRDDCIAHNLWTCYPDGTDPRSQHGNYPTPLTTMTGSNWADGRNFRPWAEMEIRAIPNSSKYVAVASGHHTYAFGELVIIDPSIVDDNKHSQVRSLTTNQTTWGDNDGLYSTPWPLSEDSILCCKGNSAISSQASDVAPNGGSIILRIQSTGKEQVIFSNNSWMPQSPIPVIPRVKPPVLAMKTFQGERASLPDHKRATLSVINVYTSDMPLDASVKVKYMRIVQVFPQLSHYINQPRVGYASESLTRMSIGTVPVESDGSVYCEAPVAKEIYFQLLDSNGLAVTSMRSGTYVHAGEQLSCVGCHEDKWNAVPPSPTTPLAFRRPPSKITPDAGGLEPINFHRIVEPIFSAKCASCHKQQGKGPDMSYGSLHDYAFYWPSTGVQVYAFTNGDITTPIQGGSRCLPGYFGAAYSRLFKNCNSSHHNVVLTKDELARISLWLDCNSNELSAYDRVSDQQQGKLVWPLIDIDTLNPQGTETNYPLPGSTDVLRDLKERKFVLPVTNELRFIELRGNSICLVDKNIGPVMITLLNLQGKVIVRTAVDAKSPFDIKKAGLSKGTYLVQALSTHLAAQTLLVTN